MSLRPGKGTHRARNRLLQTRAMSLQTPQHLQIAKPHDQAGKLYPPWMIPHFSAACPRTLCHNGGAGSVGNVPINSTMPPCIISGFNLIFGLLGMPCLMSTFISIATNERTFQNRRRGPSPDSCTATNIKAASRAVHR
jgi:hypothetical protein